MATASTTLLVTGSTASVLMEAFVMSGTSHHRAKAVSKSGGEKNTVISSKKE